MKIHIPLQLPTGRARREDAAAPVREAGWKPLSNKQKMWLIFLAKKAARHQREPQEGTEFETFRHELAVKACGKRISEATQADWGALKAAFQDAAGDHTGAFRTAVREDDNKRRIAAHKLAEVLEAKGLKKEYAESICRAQFKCFLADASAKQLWCLFFTITNRKK